MKILAICGSLRAASLNAMLLRAVVRIAPRDIHVYLSQGIGDLPLFNPDIETAHPLSVTRLRAEIMAADALIIASPEYAHGVTGAIKNALDWMVGNESFVNKPVALLNASPRATHAQAALREILLTMSAHVVDAAYVAVPMLGANIEEEGVVQHTEIRAALLTSLRLLQAAALTKIGQ